MDQLSALTNILEYNHKFNEYIIHKCPCYEIEYKDFAHVCIENRSYLACIVVKKHPIAKILHLKLPIMFGSLIDFTIRGSKIDNYNQFGCLYLDGCVKLIYNFISNNLTHGHVYTNKKEGEEIFKVDIESDDFSLHMKYNPHYEAEPLKVSIQDVRFEKNRKIEKNIADMKRTLDHDEMYENHQPKKKRQKTKIQRTYDKLTTEYKKTTNKNITDSSESVSWIYLINRKAKDMLGVDDSNVDFKEQDYLRLFDAYLKHAPKLDDISNKVNRTCTYILHRGLTHNVDSCFNNDKEMKNLNSKLSNMYKNGNMYFTLAQFLNTDNKLVKGYKSIYQNIEAQKLNLAALISSTIKRSVNDSIKNSKALMYPADGFHYTCPIDSREMKGAGENVMLSQLVIIPIGIDVQKVVTFLNEYEHELCILGENDCLLQCVLNSFLQPYKVAKSQLLKFKNKFPTLSLMVFNDYLIINTTGYNQMKYSIKYKCFMNTYEYQHIWPDAFEDYHPHLIYNNCALFLPETIELGLPAKLTVANANVRGRCADINNIMELILFLHTNGASNAAIVHRLEPGDAKAVVSFDGILKRNDYTIIIPIKLINPQMRYLNIANLGVAKTVPDNVRKMHELFNPIEDESEAYGLSLSDIVNDPDNTFENITRILFDLYVNDTRLEFIDINYENLKKTDEPLLVNDHKLAEQVIYDNKKHHIKCYVRQNTKLMSKYKKCLQFNPNKKHPPHMYVNVAFGDCLGGTNEDGIIIDKKLVEYGPKKLISQTLNITYKYEGVDQRKHDQVIKYEKIGNVVGDEIVFGCLSSNVKLSFNKTKNTTIQETFIPPFMYYYKISVENVAMFTKYITSTFSSKSCSINIHYSYIVPMGIGTKLSTGHGQKGIVCKVVDLSSIKGYTKNGDIVHPLMLLSPTSVLGRTMSNQVMSMFTQSQRAFTETGVLIAPHGVNIHNIDPSIKTKISEVKNDLMTTENGFLSNKLSYTMKVLSDQKAANKDKHKLHFVKQLCALQGISINLLAFNPAVLIQSI